MYCLIAMNDLVHSPKRSRGKTPRSLQLTLFYEQTMTKKMNHNLLNVSVCVRVFKCARMSGRVNQPIGGGSTLGRAFIPSQIKSYIKHGFKSHPRGLLKKISTPHIPDPGSSQFWERLSLPLSPVIPQTKNYLYVS